MARYRPNVAAILQKPGGKILVAERSGVKGAWLAGFLSRSVSKGLTVGVLAFIGRLPVFMAIAVVVGSRERGAHCHNRALQKMPFCNKLRIPRRRGATPSEGHEAG